MTKKEIKAMGDRTLIEHFVYASVNFGRHTKIQKCDLAHFDKLGEELIKRNILTEWQVKEIKNYSTL